jgi:hypothetical protein
LVNGFLPYSSSNNRTNNLNSSGIYLRPYQPYKVNNPQNQTIWVDPEAQYDMKIIKCDSSKNITYLDVVGKPEVSTQIIRFIFNSFNFSLTKGGTFSYTLTESGTDNNGQSYNSQINGSVSYFSIDNLDSNVNYYLTVIDSSGKGVFDGDLINYFPNNLEVISLIVNPDNLSINETKTTIPTSQIRVQDQNFPFGKLIRPSQITNQQLIISTPYSSGFYGTQ